MIQLTRLNHDEITINSDLIECLEHTPDTLIKLTTGETMMVLESVEQVVKKVVEFKRRIYCTVPGSRLDPAIPTLEVDSET